MGPFHQNCINFKQILTPQLGKTVENCFLSSLYLLKASVDNEEPQATHTGCDFNE